MRSNQLKTLLCRYFEEEEQAEEDEQGPEPGQARVSADPLGMIPKPKDLGIPTHNSDPMVQPCLAQDFLGGLDEAL